MEYPSEFWSSTEPDRKRKSEKKLEERYKDNSPKDGSEGQPALEDETYPADMYEERSEPKGDGQDKPGPKNPPDVTDPIE